MQQSRECESNNVADVTNYSVQVADNLSVQSNNVADLTGITYSTADLAGGVWSKRQQAKTATVKMATIQNGDSGK